MAVKKAKVEIEEKRYAHQSNIYWKNEPSDESFYQELERLAAANSRTVRQYIKYLAIEHARNSIDRRMRYQEPV